MIVIISLLFFMLPIAAQENAAHEFAPQSKPECAPLASTDYIASPDDTLHLPTLTDLGQMRVSMYPMEWGSMCNWDLHEGLNVSVGASVFAAFGKRAPHGAGFSQNVAAMYAAPLSGKLSLAFGGYFNNTSWLHNTYNDAGLNAVLGYKFDEHWEAYLYGQKSLLKKRMPLMIYDINNVGDRIGAAVKYNFNPSFSVQVSVSTGTHPWNDWWY